MAPKPKTDAEGKVQIAMFMDLMLQLDCTWPNIRIELFRLMQGNDAKYNEVPAQKTLERILLGHFECNDMAEYHAKRKGSIQISLKRKAVTMALSGHPTMLIFCLKNLCGWKDQPIDLSDDKLKDGIRLAYANEQKASNG